MGQSRWPRVSCVVTFSENAHKPSPNPTPGLLSTDCCREPLNGWSDPKLLAMLFLFPAESTVSNTELSEFLFALTEFRAESLVTSSRPIICAQSKLSESFAKLTELAAELSEFSPPKQCSRNSIPPVSYFLIVELSVTVRGLNCMYQRGASKDIGFGQTKRIHAKKSIPE